MIPLKLASGALASLFVLGSAKAATSSVQVDHLRLQLIDLDTSDGITPSFSMYSAMTTFRVFEGYTQVKNWSTPAGPFSASNAGAFSTAGSLGGDVFSSSGWSGTASSGSHIVGWGGNASVHLDIGFTLTPNTLLLVTTDAPVLQVATDPYEFASAEAELTLRDAGKYFSRAYVSIPFLPATTFPLQASFANVSSSTTYGELDMKIISHTFSVGLPVPEPETAVLLAAGLFTVAAARRQRS